MKIGIDIQSTIGKKTGIGVSTDELVRAIKEIDNQNQYYYYFCRRLWSERVPRRMLWESLELPIAARKDKIDILHIPGFASPVCRGCKTIVTVNDLIGSIFPQNLGTFSRFYWKSWLPFTVKKADRIIAISENTKQDLIRLLGINSNKISVIYLGVSEKFRPITDKEASTNIEQKYGIKGDYILHVSSIEPRKNTIGLLKAYNLLRKKIADLPKLVFIGSRAWAYTELKRLIEELSLQHNVTITGYVDEEDIPLIYANARLFVFPSFYEGFGMPVLEAMASGVPVIASNKSSIPEVVGDAGILVDPYNIEEIADAMYHGINDVGLAKQLIEKGLKRAKNFSWKNTASKMIEEYRMVYNGKVYR